MVLFEDVVRFLENNQEESGGDRETEREKDKEKTHHKHRKHIDSHRRLQQLAMRASWSSDDGNQVDFCLVLVSLPLLRLVLLFHTQKND